MIRSACIAALLAVPLSGAQSLPAPRTHVVRIDAMQFGTMPAGVRVGDTIVWINADLVPHTATASDGSFSAELPAGSRSATRVRKAGAIGVVCVYHPGMKTTLNVGPRGRA